MPTVKFKAEAVPIPGFPHTGNILGAGAALKAEYEISGTEYHGSPPPIIGVNFYLPTGTKLHPSGFPTCTNATLEQFGPVKCPKGSAAGPIGKVLGFVTFGGERVEEEAELSSFYAPGGGFVFFTDGHSPVSLEILSQGPLRQPRWWRRLRPGADHQVPLVASVPGAPYASVKTIDVKAGSAIDQDEREEGHLLRPGPHEVPERRLPGEDGSDLRGKRRRIETGDRDGDVQGAVPAQVTDACRVYALEGVSSTQAGPRGDLVEDGGVARSL